MKNNYYHYSELFTIIHYYSLLFWINLFTYSGFYYYGFYSLYSNHYHFSPAPGLAKVQRGGAALAALPSALPEANGFVALVADAPMPLDPLDAGAVALGEGLGWEFPWVFPVKMVSFP